jgi:hypothetical protein
MTPNERADLIRRYAEGAEVLEAAFRRVPSDALKWRPAPGKWSVHEVVVHCADSEANAHMRLRFLLGEVKPVLQGYDQDRWAIELAYHEHPLEPALAVVRAVRANTLPILRRLADTDWKKAGHHTEHPHYGVEKWLEIYGEHLEIHAKQIERNVEAWSRQGGKA